MNDIRSGAAVDPDARLLSGNMRSWPLARVELLSVLLITFVAFVLRLYHSGASSLWVDEAASLAFSKMAWVDLFTTLPAIETNPPLYYAILKGWTSLAGTSEIALRLPGVLAGTASVLILFLVARKTYGRTAAVVAASFLAFSAVHVSYAQEARVTSMVTLLFVIGLGLVHELVFRLQDQRQTWPVWLALSVVTAGLPYLHYSAFFVAVILGFYALLLLFLHGDLHRVSRHIGIVVVLVLVLALPPVLWAVGLMGHSDNPVGWLKSPSIADAKYVFHQAFGHGYLPFGRPEWLPALVPDSSIAKLFATRRIAEISLLLICTVGVLVSLRQKEWSIPALVVTLAMVVVVFFGISQIKPILIERTIIFAIPMLALIVGYSASVFRWKPVITLAALSMMLFQAINLSAYYPRAEKEPWRALFVQAKTAYQDGNAVIFASGPYLSPTISSTVLAEYYWPNLPKRDTFSLRPETERLHELGLTWAPWVKDLDLKTACPQLTGTTGVMVVFRHADDAGNLAQTLGAQGSRLLTRTEESGLGFELWSVPKCT